MLHTKWLPNAYPLHPTEVLHSLVEVGNILHMVVHPNQPVRNMRPSPLPPNILRAGQGWSTSRKQTPHLEKIMEQYLRFVGEIYLLLWGTTTQD